MIVITFDFQCSSYCLMSSVKMILYDVITPTLLEGDGASHFTITDWGDVTPTWTIIGAFSGLLLIVFATNMSLQFPYATVNPLTRNQ